MELGDLKDLKKFKVEGCGLKEVPPPVKRKCVAAGSTGPLLDYLRRLKRQAEWKQMKLMVLGQEAVGKTSLINCILDHRIERQKGGDPLATQGIDIDKWKVNDIYFSVWDFGGQEVCRTFLNFFFQWNG